MSLLPAIIFGPRSCTSLADGDPGQREWLITDGLGGFACGTVAGLRTRRYHGLLVVADPHDEVRRLALASLDLTLTLPSGAAVPLYSHQWASGVISPAGHRHLETFALVDGLPRWRWRVGDVVIERELAMQHGTASLAVVHRVVAAPAAVALTVGALCTWRDAHGTRRASGPGLAVRQVADGAIVEGAYRLAGPGWQPAGEWHLGAYAREEAAGGLDATEDLWLAGSFTARVAAGATMEISAWAGDLSTAPPPAGAVVAAARERSHRLIARAKPVDDHAATLAGAADAFIVDTPDGPDVVAGYPWLGRHLSRTMAAYEGLLLATGRADEGRELLLARTRAALRAARGQPAPAAGTAWGPREAPDAPLWLVHAVDRHVVRTGDSALAADMIGPLTRLLRAHLGGSGPLRVDPADELLRIDPAAEQLRIEPAAEQLRIEPATDGGHGPAGNEGQNAARIGKPVEVNALWVNALAAMGALMQEAGRDNSAVRARHRRAQASFAARFRAPEGWLYDVIDGPAATYPLGAGAYHDDPSMRPNQLLAWSLPHAPLAGSGPAGPAAIGAALLTPLGLRTLAPGEYGYQGAPAGTPADRDLAHHQGTVWPWLIGPYVDACVNTGLPTAGLLHGLQAHVPEWGVGSVSETAEGDAPHRATGCPFSARSVAELLRVDGHRE
ncbi:MAG TPA: glycogen debranching enzyme N-terminal domain-containing protein [Actinoplanes sp.]|nr:glycogen debranching enzyme N-terminal domain-containing protein [Actinoplanes sp.]